MKKQKCIVCKLIYDFFISLKLKMTAIQKKTDVHYEIYEA